jgi:hypothetical protein
MFVSFSKSHYLYFMHLNTFFWDVVCGFRQTLKGVHDIKKWRTRALDRLIKQLTKNVSESRTIVRALQILTL